MLVQCISTKSGFYSDIKLCQWYEAEFVPKYNYYKIGERAYDTNLFRTKDERREERLNTITFILKK